MFIFLVKYINIFIEEGKSMLLSLKVKNFCSFKNEFEFSMKPGKVMPRFSDNVINLGNKKVSKVCVVAGENAGGKN